MDGYSTDITEEQRAKLREIFPEIFTEDKIDWQQLKATLGGELDLGEKYGLSWKGKADVFAKIQEKTVSTLHPQPEESIDWDTTQNMFIEGDNLEALKVLHKAYYGKIKMIYIDPPYNTGNDFVYNDDFKKTRREQALEEGAIDDEGNTTRDDGLRVNTGGHKHSNWLDMMYPRLFLARNLLRQDGVIFVSIDYNENYNLRMIMNEIFGEEHFVGEIYWESKTKSQNTETSYNKLQPKAEMILVYAKQDKRRFNLVAKAAKEYPLSDEQGHYREYPLEVMNASGIRGRKSMIYEVEGVSPPEGKQWKLGVDQVSAYKNSGNLFVRDGKVIIKMRPDSERAETTEPFWGFLPKDIGTAESAKKELKELVGDHDFETVKPVELIKRLVYHATEKDDIVLDFFSGSGTTGQAVMELNADDDGNRKWLCVQLPEETDVDSILYERGFKTIAEFTRYRLKAASEKIKVFSGYRWYKLGNSNFKKWNEFVTDPEELKHQAKLQLNPLEDRVKDEDLLTEVLLKRGISPLAEIEAHDGFVFISSESLAISLSRHMTEELFVQIIAKSPSQIILLDQAFGNDVSLKTNLIQQAEKRSIVTEVL